MTKKSYITLCITGILYIIMATTAILSPHGNNFSAATDPNAQGTVPGVNDQFVDIDAQIIITNKSGIQVPIDLKSMPAFTPSLIEYNDGEEAKSFTAATLERVIKLSALQVGEQITLTDVGGDAYTISVDALDIKDNVYLCYADADKQPLSDEYGHFCIVIVQGETSGIYRAIVNIHLG